MKHNPWTLANEGAVFKMTVGGHETTAVAISERDRCRAIALVYAGFGDGKEIAESIVRHHNTPPYTSSEDLGVVMKLARDFLEHWNGDEGVDEEEAAERQAKGLAYGRFEAYLKSLEAPADPAKPQVRMVCRECGSPKVQADAYASWSFEAQEWVLDITFDKGAVCEECGGECRIKEQTLLPVGTRIISMHGEVSNTTKADDMATGPNAEGTIDAVFEDQTDCYSISFKPSGVEVFLSPAELKDAGKYTIIE